MSNQSSSFDCTHTDLEKVALSRFRTLVGCLPSDCKVFREPWGCSTVLCLDFAACPFELEKLRFSTDIITEVISRLGLAHSVVLRVDNKFKGWISISLNC